MFVYRYGGWAQLSGTAVASCHGWLVGAKGERCEQFGSGLCNTGYCADADDLRFNALMSKWSPLENLG